MNTAAVKTRDEKIIDTDEVKEPRLVPALKNVANTTGDALHTVGTHVADANLRKLGKGFKSLTSRLPRVRIERN